MIINFSKIFYKISLEIFNKKIKNMDFRIFIIFLKHF